MISTAKRNKSTDYKTEMKNHPKAKRDENPSAFKNFCLIWRRVAKAGKNF